MVGSIHVGFSPVNGTLLDLGGGNGGDVPVFDCFDSEPASSTVSR